MFVPIGLLVSLILISFILGLVTVPLVVLAIIKAPVRLQPKSLAAAQRK